MPTSPKRKNREYRTASGKRRALSSKEHTTVWSPESTEEEEGGREVAAKDDIETGREEVEIGREELDDADAERVKGTEVAE